MRPTAASPPAAITCRDLSSRPAWREVVSIRSRRGAISGTTSAPTLMATCGDAEARPTAPVSGLTRAAVREWAKAQGSR
jgi:hypothetical protein